MIKLRLKHVLVPTDFSEVSEYAFMHALKIAGKTNSKLSIIHVKESFSHEMILPEIISRDIEIQDDYDKKVSDLLEGWRELALKQGIKQVELFILNGRIAQEISVFTEKEKVDLVVMGTNGSKGAEEFFLGSNAYRVLCSVKCPVLTVRNETHRVSYDSIVVPMDETPFSRNKLPFCADWAKVFDSQLKLLCICESVDENQIKHLNAVCNQVSSYFENENVNFTINHTEADNTALEVVRYAEYSDADLIIIMSEKETTIAQMLMGTYAQQVINHSKVPVLTIHPEPKDIPLDIFG